MNYDVVIIGAGPGGYTAAIRLGQMGKKILIVEKNKVGGVCLNRGCIPTKALLHVANILELKNNVSSMGLNLDIQFDINKIQNWKNKVVTQLNKGIEYLLKGNKVELIYGEAKVLTPNTVLIKKPDLTNLEVNTNNIIIATGSEPIELPFLKVDNKKVFYAEEALFFTHIPKDIVIIGAGVTGLEMGTIYSKLGSKVSIIEIMPQIVPGSDTEMANNLMKILQKQGIDILVNSTVKEVTETTVTVQKDGVLKNIEYECILLCVGRRPVIDSINDLTLKLTDKKFIEVNNQLKTSIPNIYAIGDVNGPPLLAHKAMKEGIVAAENISGYNVTYSPKAMPSCIFTLPPLSSVGLTEEQAKAKGFEINIGKFPYRACGKALASGEVEGLIKIIEDKNTGKLLGMHILGAESPSLIGEGVLALELDAKVKDIASAIHPHPTLSEIIPECAESVYKQAIHILNK